MKRMIKTIGIRREDKNRWERRVPVIPDHMRQLVEQAGFKFVIQPSDHRVFMEQEFTQWGASVCEDLNDCDVILNVKEVPIEKILSDKIYLLFSHTIKGQAHNLPMLQKFMEQRCTLIDYECITDEQGRRLVFFGRYAGMAGMLETLRGLGLRWQQQGWNTPLSEILPAFAYGTVEEARLHIATLAQALAACDGPFAAAPVVVGFSGYGQVSKGAQEIFDLWPCRTLAPDKLADAKPWPGFYKTVFTEADMFAPIQDHAPFTLSEYYSHPENYRSRFDGYLPFLTALVNGIYWDQHYPRLVTKNKIAELYQRRVLPLQIIGDISCDIHGAIECTDHITTPISRSSLFILNQGLLKKASQPRAWRFWLWIICRLPCRATLPPGSARLCGRYWLNCPLLIFMTLFRNVLCRRRCDRRLFCITAN